MKYKICRRWQSEPQDWLVGFCNFTGEAWWSNDEKEARIYDDRNLANVAACNANEHTSIHGDPTIVEYKDFEC